MPWAVSLGVGQNSDSGSIAVTVPPIEQEDRKRLTIEFLPLNSDDLPADKPRVVLPLAFRLGAKKGPTVRPMGLFFLCRL